MVFSTMVMGIKLSVPLYRNPLTVPWEASLLLCKSKTQLGATKSLRPFQLLRDVTRHGNSSNDSQVASLEMLTGPIRVSPPKMKDNAEVSEK